VLRRNPRGKTPAGILVMVAGSIALKGEAASRRFVQTFLLVHRANSYYIRNDMHRLLDRAPAGVPPPFRAHAAALQPDAPPHTNMLTYPALLDAGAPARGDANYATIGETATLTYVRRTENFFTFGAQLMGVNVSFEAYRARAETARAPPVTRAGKRATRR
jgi:hypothetical protein